MIQMTSAFDGGHQLGFVVNEGEWVTARGRYIGKYTGKFNGISRTGKKVAHTSAAELQQHMDKCVRTEFSDTAAYENGLQIITCKINY